MKNVVLLALLALAAGVACATSPARTDDDAPRAIVATAAAAPAPGPAPRAMRVVEQRSARDPIVSVRLLFESGSRDDPAGKEGLTALTMALMAEATEKLTASALRDTLFPWAAELEVETDKETSVLVARVHQDHALEMADLLLDMLAHPRLDPHDFERLRADRASYLERTLRTGNDEALQREALEVMLYDAPTLAGTPTAAPRHAYRHTPEGTVRGLAAITIDDVKAQRARVITRDRLTLGVAGGASDALLEKLRAGLATLPAVGAPRAPLPPSPTLVRNGALLIDKPSAATAISLGYPLSVDRADPDYAALKLAEAWFGEHRNMIGWLFHALRDVRGLNYGDYAYVEHFQQEGWSTWERLNIGRRQQYFSMWIRPVEHKNRLFALRAATFELARFAARGIPDDGSFGRLQSFVQGYWRGKQQEPMRRLGYALDDTFYGLGEGGREALLAKMATLTRDDVNRAIHKHLRGERLAIVVVTEGADKLAAELVEGGPSPITYPANVPPEILEEDKLIQSYDLKLSKETVHVVQPGVLFER